VSYKLELSIAVYLLLYEPFRFILNGKGFLTFLPRLSCFLVFLWFLAARDLTISNSGFLSSAYFLLSSSLTLLF